MDGRVGEKNVVGVVAVVDGYPSANTTDWLEARKTRRDRRLFSVADVAASQPRRGLPRASCDPTAPIAAAVGASRPRSYSRRRGDDGRSRADAGAGAPTSRVASRRGIPR